MSKEALTSVIQRAISDPTFRRSLVMDPTALGAFDLTDNEVAALRSGDATRLTAFGIDQRMSKIFMIDPGATGASVLAGLGSEPRDVEPYWVGGAPQSATTAGGTDDGQLIPGTWTDATTGAVEPGTAEPRDIEPTWVGGSDDAIAGATGNEPRDVEPTDISGTVTGEHGEY